MSATDYLDWFNTAQQLYTSKEDAEADVTFLERATAQSLWVLQRKLDQGYTLLKEQWIWHEDLYGEEHDPDQSAGTWTRVIRFRAEIVEKPAREAAA